MESPISPDDLNRRQYELLTEHLLALRQDMKEVQRLLCLSKESGDILTLDQACIILGRSKSSIYKLTSNNKLPHFKIGRHLRFVRSEIIAWIDAHRY